MPSARLHRRFVLVPLFGLALAGSYHSASRVARLTGIRTDEGQLVAFDRDSYNGRELAKKLPLDEPWPKGGADREKVYRRFGLDPNAAPKTPLIPSQIIGDVYLVGQGRVTNLTYMIDCGSEGVALIDPTYDSEFEQTLANVEACGRASKEIKWVINTHCHVDHAEADHKFRGFGAQIIIHEADAAAIEKGTRVTGVTFKDGKEFPVCKVDRRLSDGERLKLGNKIFEVIHTPGHTPGSACFLLQIEGKNVLFSGDTILVDGSLGSQGDYADNNQYLASMKKLEFFMLGWQKPPLRWDMLLPGHRCIALDQAFLDVKKCRERLEHDLAAGREITTSRFTPEYRQKLFGRPATPLNFVTAEKQ
jgi:glyoxylase-like metal-dependent hydrolase (beta-lactamase superfamily II)